MAAVAVLVDGDNLSGRHAARVLEIAQSAGNPSVLRVYTGAQCGSDWHAEHGFRLNHAGTGKNAADLLLALDAMELTLTKGFDRFVIASSDGDFAHLAQRLREYGAQVTGVGESKTPPRFRAACAEFVLVGPEAEEMAPQIRLLAGDVQVAEMDRQIRSLIAEHSRQGAGMSLVNLGTLMHVRHGKATSALAEGNWRGYLGARPALFALDFSGPEVMVRFLPQGFARAA